MTIAYTIAPGRGDTDLLLHRFAMAAMAQGAKVVGAVQINSENPKDGPCDMDVQVLPRGPIIRISQSLGPASRGCRLDPSTLEQAVGLVSTAFTSGTDLVVINKFGKHEAEGRGFRDVIAEAFAAQVPILVGTNALNREALMAFCGDAAVEVAPNSVALTKWYQSQIRLRRRIPSAQV